MLGQPDFYRTNIEQKFGVGGDGNLVVIFKWP